MPNTKEYKRMMETALKNPKVLKAANALLDVAFGVIRTHNETLRERATGDALHSAAGHIWAKASERPAIRKVERLAKHRGWGHASEKLADDPMHFGTLHANHRAAKNKAKDVLKAYLSVQTDYVDPGDTLRQKLLDSVDKGIQQGVLEAIFTAAKRT